MNRGFFFLLAVCSAVLVPAGTSAQVRVRCAVSYLAVSTVYLDAGRDAGLTVGDTMRVIRGATEIASLKITAVSRKSSAALVIHADSALAVGDSVFSIRLIEPPKETPVVRHRAAADSARSPAGSLPAVPPAAAENRVSGRVGLQYAGSFAGDSRFNMSQPSAMVRLNVDNCFGTGIVFNLYSRTYYDLTEFYQRFGESSRSKTRLYELQVQYEPAGGMVGAGFGRMTSRFVGSFGTFDGGYITSRIGEWTAGLLAGADVPQLYAEINTLLVKEAVFVNYRRGPDYLHYYDGTVAYVRAANNGILDRDFLYVQNAAALGSEFSLYHSSEIDLHDINEGVRSAAFRLTNTYVSLNYYPAFWLSAYAGYDGTRSIYLFESMKTFPDTLMDKNIMQGFRASATVRLPHTISVSSGIVYRTKKGDDRDAHTVDLTVRAGDVFASGIGAGLRAADIAGVYMSGTNATFDVDRMFFNALSVSLRYDYYGYRLRSLPQFYITHTMTISCNYRISRMFYASFSGDRIIDKTMNSTRVFMEIGMRF